MRPKKKPGRRFNVAEARAKIEAVLGPVDYALFLSHLGEEPNRKLARKRWWAIVKREKLHLAEVAMAMIPERLRHASRDAYFTVEEVYSAATLAGVPYPALVAGYPLDLGPEGPLFRGGAVAGSFADRDDGRLVAFYLCHIYNLRRIAYEQGGEEKARPEA